MRMAMTDEQLAGYDRWASSQSSDCLRAVSALVAEVRRLKKHEEPMAILDKYYQQRDMAKARQALRIKSVRELTAADIKAIQSDGRGVFPLLLEQKEPCPQSPS
jgi:hypothetical protein